MSSLARLGLFAALLVLVFGGAALAGETIGPEGQARTQEAPTHAMQAAGEAGDGAGAGHESEPGPSSDAAAGLAVAEGGYRLVTDDVRFEAGGPERFEFRILGPDGAPVGSFDEEHERQLHLIVVRRDTQHYRHLHPVRGADGTWSAQVELPEGGVYRAYTDFNVDGANHTLATDLFARGEFRPQSLPAPSSTATASGYDVALTSSEPVAGEPAELAFRVSRGGEPVDDLEPYLGALGHLVALRDGDLAFLHVHPEEDHGGAEAEDAHDEASTDEAEDTHEEPSGDEIRFAAEFPTAGRYRLFLQFRDEGRVRTVDYTVEVPR
jgi:hypothetical protein